MKHFILGIQEKSKISKKIKLLTAPLMVKMQQVSILGFCMFLLASYQTCSLTVLDKFPTTGILKGFAEPKKISNQYRPQKALLYSAQ